MIADRHPEALVQTDWLEAHLGEPDLRIFECTTYLRYAEPGAGVPYRPEAGRADYDAGHIPGAGFLDLPGELSRQDAPVHFMMLPPERFAKVMGRHGIGDGTRVVLYSRDRIMWATRVWWMLHAMGFDAAVLDGGFEKWAAEGRPVSSESSPYPPATFTPRPRPGLFVDRGTVLKAIDDPSICLINTLSEPDFRGAEPSRYGRPGRVPRSVNLPWPELTAPGTNVLIPLDEAAKRSRLWAPIGPSASSATAAAASLPPRVYCFCTASATTTLRCTTPRWPEWARDESLPIERG